MKTMVFIFFQLFVSWFSPFRFNLNFKSACGEPCLVYKVGIGVGLPCIAYAVCCTFNYHTVSFKLYLFLCVDLAELTCLVGNFQSPQSFGIACLQFVSIVELNDSLAVETERSGGCRSMLCNMAHAICLVQRKACKALANGGLLLGVDVGEVAFVA